MRTQRVSLLILAVVLSLTVVSCFDRDDHNARGGGGSGSSDQFDVGLVPVMDLETLSRDAFSNIGNDPLARGRVEVEELSKNEVEVRVRGAAANVTYIVNFCSFATGTSGCFEVSQVRTDARGNGKREFGFPRRGGFTGVFLLTRGNQNQFVTAFSVPPRRREEGHGDEDENERKKEEFEVALQPVSVINDGLGSGFGPNGDDPLRRGKVEVERENEVEVRVTGATANASYNVKFCRFGRSAARCIDIPGRVLTDQNGDAKAELRFPEFGTFDGVFILTRRVGGEDRNQFVTGFRIL